MGPARGKSRGEKTFFSWRATRVAHKSARDLESIHFSELDGDYYCYYYYYYYYYRYYCW